jgi:O-antigen/teichoic acid export membrane protein
VVTEAAAQPRRRDRADVFFRTDHLKSELKKRTVRGGAVTMVGQGGKFGLTLLSNVVLYRLAGLTPADNGLLAMVLTITGVVTLFKDLGLSRATVQKDQITREETSTLFWVNSGIGLLAMIVTAALAPAIAWFYGEPRLTSITLLLSTGFLLGGTAVQHTALLQRQMQFATIAVVDLASMLVGIAVGVACAFLKMGYWSLVYMQLATTVAGSIGIWIACPWRPGLAQRGTDVKSQLKFGGNLAGFNILNYLQRNVDNLIVGKMSGNSALGLYNKAYQLLMLPVNQISTPMSNVAVPALSRLQKEPERYRSYYRKAIEMITCVSMPIVAMLFVLADDLILTLLGKNWASASVIFRWLVPAAFIGTFNVATGWVYTSLGRTDRQLLMALVVSPITIAGFFIGAWWGGPERGALGVAASFSITTVLLRWPTIVYCFRGTPLSSRDLFAAVGRPMAASLGAGAGLYVIDKALDPFLLYPWVRLMAGAVNYGLLYVAAWFVLPGGRQFIRDAGGLFRELMGKKPKQPPRGFDVKPAAAAKVSGDDPQQGADTAPAVKVA